MKAKNGLEGSARKKMSKRDEHRKILIRSAVNVVARDGLEHTTVGRLAQWAQMSESTLYRCFENKDDLLRAALYKEDEDFAVLVQSLYPVLLDESLDWWERCWRLWKPVWEFILEEPEDCVFYIRYYYSENFRRNAMHEHERQFDPIREKLKCFFLPGRRDGILLHQTFETMLSYAYRVMLGDLPNDESTCRLAFEQICNFLRPHFRTELLEPPCNPAALMV